MSTELRENLAELLVGFNGSEDYDKVKSLVESAFTGASAGANHFLDTIGRGMQPSDLPSLLRLYPTALIMIGIMQHFELNHEMDSVEAVLTSILEQLRQKNESKTIH